MARFYEFLMDSTVVSWSKRYASYSKFCHKPIILEQSSNIFLFFFLAFLKVNGLVLETTI